MFRILSIIIVSTVYSFGAEILELQKQDPSSVFKKELQSPFLSRDEVQKICSGKIWRLRPSSVGVNHEPFSETIELLARVIARHAYADENPLNFAAFESIRKTTQDAAMKEHLDYINGIILASRLLKNPITYNNEDSRVLSELKKTFNKKILKKFVEWSYDSLDEIQKREKEFVFGKLKGLFVEKELSRAECLHVLGDEQDFASLTDEQLRDAHALFRIIEKKGVHDIFDPSKISSRQDMIPTDNIKYLVRSAYFLLRPDSSTLNPHIFNLLQNIPPLDRADVVAQTLRLFEESTSLKTALYFLYNVSVLPQSERQDILTQSLRLKSLYDTADIVTVMKKVSSLPLSEREEVVSRTLQFIPQYGLNETEISDLMSVIHNIRREQREDILGQALRLVKPKMGGGYIGYLLDAIANIQTEQREDILAKVSRFIEPMPNMKGDDVGHLVRVIKSIPPEKYEDISQITLNTVKYLGLGNSSRVADLMSSINDISSRRKRIDIIKSASKFFRRGMSCLDVAYIIDAIADMPLGDREGILMVAESCCKRKKMTSFEVLGLFDEIAKTPLEERGELIIKKQSQRYYFVIKSSSGEFEIYQ